MGENLINITEAAKKIGVSIDTLRRWDKSGKLAAIRPGKGAHRLYRLEDIEVFMMDLFTVAKRWTTNDVGKPPDSIFYCPTSDRFRARLQTMEILLKEIMPEQFSLVSSVVGEIGNNSFDHNFGQWPDVSGIFFGYDLNKKVIVLGDRGLGILATLKRVKKELNNDSEALKTAFNEVITGRAPEHRGNGLKYVKLVVSQSPIELMFQTGNAKLYLKQADAEVKVKPADFSFRGCLARIEFYTPLPK